MNISKIDLEFLCKNNTYYKKETNSIKKEKYFLFIKHYNFILNDTCLDFIEKSFNIINENLVLSGKKYEKWYTDEIIITVCVILLKSKLDHLSPTSKNLIINSDDCLNYCSEKFVNYCLSENLYVNKKWARQMFFIFIDLLIKNNLIESHKLTFRDDFKTIINYHFHTINYFKIYEELINVSYIGYELINFNDEIYSKSLHFFTFQKLCRENFFSNKSFKPKDLKYLSKKINIKIYVDTEIIKNEYGVEDKNIILNDIIDLEIQLKNIYDKKTITKDMKDKIAEIQKKHSKLIEKFIINLFVLSDIEWHEIYFPLYMDFRGRKYYDSTIGPTQSKILRSSFYYGYYTEKDFLKRKLPECLLDYYEDIKILCEKNNFEFKDYFFDSFFWCVIGIGKFLIDKNKNPTDVKEFIYKTSLWFEKKDFSMFKIQDKIEIKHYIRIMENLTIKNMENGKIKKWIIIKDATASINQVLMKKLQPLSEYSMNLVNLGSKNEYYDTYVITRDLFIQNYDIKKLFSLSEETIKINLQRILIKKMIMTIPYSAGWELCWNNYIDKIMEEELNIEINKELKELIKLFYTFIKKEMQVKYLYKKSTKKIVEQLIEEFEQTKKSIIESETGECDIAYFKMKKSSIEKKYNYKGKKERITKLVLEVTKALDIKSFKSACMPNFTHFWDADEIREIELMLDKCFITIHDSYLVDFLTCTDLILAKQEHYKKHIKNYKITNIFIII